MSYKNIDLVLEIEHYRVCLEKLLHKDFGEIMLKKFIKYIRLLEITNVKLVKIDNEIKIRILDHPITLGRCRNSAQYNLLVHREHKKWSRLYNTMLSQAEPYLIAEQL